MKLLAKIFIKTYNLRIIRLNVITLMNFKDSESVVVYSDCFRIKYVSPEGVKGHNRTV